MTAKMLYSPQSPLGRRAGSVGRSSPCGQPSLLTVTLIAFSAVQADGVNRDSGDQHGDRTRCSPHSKLPLTR
jgi:hypothetical protein